ncbi:MAG: hypothetical protein WAW96_04240 [Alphaproteobacteria bacterium]
MANRLLRLGLAAGAFALAIGFVACGKQGSSSSEKDNPFAKVATQRGSDSGSQSSGGDQTAQANDGGSSATVSAPSSGPDTLLEKITPQDVTSALDALNIPYQVQTDPRGFPMVVVDPRKFPIQQFNILFFSCDKVEGQCDDIALWAWYDKAGQVNEKAIYAWNDPFQARRWSTAYVDKDNDPSLVMNINATGGIGERALQILVNTYIEDLFAFKDLLKTATTAQTSENTSSSSSAPSYGWDTSAAVDGDIIAMTNLIKVYGGSTYEHVKEDEKKD